MRVHQILACMETGDAVSNQALAIHDALREWGIESLIYAQAVDPSSRRLASLDREYKPFMDSRDDLLIYHYSIYCENYRLFLKSRNHKMLVYHNITPAEFFEGFHAEAAENCRRGRELLPSLRDCDLAVGDSDFNRRELVEVGFEEEKTGVLPILPHLDRLGSVPADTAFERDFDDGKVNFLFVGRVAPNKKIEDLIKLFCAYHRGINACSRLFIAGIVLTTYCSALLALVHEMGLDERVHFLDKVGDSRLKSLYRTAHYYVSMSEHEGFCVPPLEASYFSVPVLAYDAGAVAETMGDAGVLFDEKDYPLLAELIDRLEHDSLQRERIINAQLSRLDNFSIDNFRSKLRAVLLQFIPSLEVDEVMEVEV